MTEAEEAFLLCLSLEQQERVQILLGERDLAVYTMQAERTLLAEERKNCDYLMGKLAEALKRAEAAEAELSSREPKPVPPAILADHARHL